MRVQALIQAGRSDNGGFDWVLRLHIFLKVKVSKLNQIVRTCTEIETRAALWWADKVWLMSNNMVLKMAQKT